LLTVTAKADEKLRQRGFRNPKRDCTRPLTLHPPAYLSPNRLTIKHNGNLIIELPRPRA